MNNWLKRALDLQKIVSKKNARRERYMIQIREPIWSSKSVGVRQDLITHTNYIEILHKDVLGNRVYPYIYRVAGLKLMSCPTQTVKGQVLHIIPISEMEIYEVHGKKDE